MGKTVLSTEIFVLNYNGKSLLEECLPSILEASTLSPVPCSVTVIDNCSVDGSVEFLSSQFPQVRLYLPKKNLVLCSFNEAVRESRADIVFLLNNDVRVSKNFVAPLAEIFREYPDALFAAPRVLNYRTGELEGAASKMDYRHGLLWGEASLKVGSEKERVSHSMQCGMGAFRRDRFLELGGYDDLYLPGTVEDSDLCFRGWRRGWKGYYCQDSIIHHMGQTTFKREFGACGIRRINRRNLYLFVWKNVRDPWLLAVHFLFMPAHLLKYCLFGQIEFVQGFFDALGRLPNAIKKRGDSLREPVVVPDRAVFAISKGI